MTFGGPNHLRSIEAIESREIDRHVSSILARVERLHPKDPRGQRRAIARWSRLLWANDRGVAERLLDARPGRAR